MQRRRLLTLAAALGLAGSLAACGFALKGATPMPFASIFIDATEKGPVVTAFRRHLADSPGLQVLELAEERERAQVRLRIDSDGRQQRNIGANTYGLTRERQLSTTFTYSLEAANGQPLGEAVSLSQHRDINYDESLALSKEAEEDMLYQDMAEDLAAQVMRRLAAVKLPTEAAPPAAPQP